jgi:hypothetical protein
LTSSLPGYPLVDVDPVAALEARIGALESSLHLVRVGWQFNLQTDFGGDLALALANVPAGCGLFIPKGSWALNADTAGLRLAPITIFGVGRESVIVPFTTKNSCGLIFGNGSTAAFNNILLANFAIVPAGAISARDGTGDGIRFVTPLSGNYSTVEMTGLTISGMGRRALMTDVGSGSSVDLLTATNCRFYLSRHKNVYMGYTAAPKFTGCYINGAEDDGAYLGVGCGAASFVGCYFENNWVNSSGTPAPDATLSNQLRADACHGLSIFGGTVENWGTAGGGTALTAIGLNACHGVTIDGVNFVNPSAVNGTRAINAHTGGSCTVGGRNTYTNVDIVADSSTGDANVVVSGGAIVTYDGTNARARVLSVAIDHTTNTSRPHGQIQLFGAEKNLTNQTASIGSTKLITGNAFTAGRYRVTPILSITTTAGVPTVQGQLQWTSLAGAQTKNFPAAALSFAALADSPDTTSVDLYMTAATDLTFTTTVTGAIGTGKYALSIRVEAL